MTSPATVNRSNWCLKCVQTQKSGKRSCCARGGAWFKNCGDASGTEFDHTWAEGIQACKGIGSLISVKSSLQGILHHVEHNAYPVNDGKSRKVTHTGGAPYTSAVDFIDCVLLVKVAVCVFYYIRFSEVLSPPCCM